jgi:hypothetical protein
VDNTISNSIASELGAYKSDLIADGWQVTITNAPRHMDPAYPDPWTGTNWYHYTNQVSSAMTTNRVNATALKNYITAWHNIATNDTNVVVILGHVTVPYSGDAAEDGHAEMQGAWPTDSWYGDMTGTWTDAGTLTYANPISANFHNDGRWNENKLPLEPDGSPGRLELAVSRIDFRMLQDFRQGSEEISNAKDDTEIRLTKAYLSKVAQFRRGQTAHDDDISTYVFEEPFKRLWPTAMRIQKRAWSVELTDPARYRDDLFMPGPTRLIGLIGNFGGFDRIGKDQIGDTLHTVSEIASGLPKDIPRTMFQVFRGSYFGMWLNGDSNGQARCFLRAVLAVPDASLTATWLGNADGETWRMDRFLTGAHYGTALQDTFASNPHASCRATVILGDLTLRAHPIAGTANLSASKVGIKNLGYDISLNWTATTNATEGYRILWAPSTDSASWQFLVDVNTTNWTHTTSNPSTNVYLVKALSRKITGTGAYTNSSLGKFSNLIAVP